MPGPPWIIPCLTPHPWRFRNLVVPRCFSCKNVTTPPPPPSTILFRISAVCCLMGGESCNAVVHVIVTTSAVLLDCILAPALTRFELVGASSPRWPSASAAWKTSCSFSILVCFLEDGGFVWFLSAPEDQPTCPRSVLPDCSVAAVATEREAGRVSSWRLA